MLGTELTGRLPFKQVNQRTLTAGFRVGGLSIVFLGVPFPSGSVPFSGAGQTRQEDEQISGERHQPHGCDSRCLSGGRMEVFRQPRNDLEPPRSISPQLVSRCPENHPHSPLRTTQNILQAPRSTPKARPQPETKNGTQTGPGWEAV